MEHTKGSITCSSCGKVVSLWDFTKCLGCGNNYYHCPEHEEESTYRHRKHDHEMMQRKKNNG
jgi:hypothetical protein